MHTVDTAKLRTASIADPPDSADLARWEQDGGRPSVLAESEVSAMGAMRTRVLVASHMAPLCALAMARAQHLSLTADVEICLLHVLSGAIKPKTFCDEGELRRLWAEAALPASFGGDGHGAIEPRLLLSNGPPPGAWRGKASSVIVRTARAQGSDLIVIGRNGTSPVDNRLLGPTARGVLRNARSAVLVVSQPVDGPYRQVLVAVDGSQSSLLAVAAALDLAEVSEASFDVLYAYGALADELPSDFEAGDYERRARRRLERLLLPCFGRKASWNVLVERGDPREVIVDAGAARGCDLIVVGARGRAGIGSILTRSIAEEVAGVARCDVLVVPSAEDGD